jgi:protein required for attachment to host cells
MRIRIVSANQSAATFYDLEHLADGLHAARRLEHHGTGGERSPHKHEAQLFARQIAAELEHERQGFDRLVLVAGPEMLGLLRAALSDSLRARVSAEVDKDLEGQPSSAVLEHLPRTVFARPTYP